ncbi:hypothetical protein SIAM614_30686 [Stappia aggregata IAM 12614]|uniref:Uncharacterized protein n=2 Tax=Roseibium aggregatum TaxID=187304 RepID=A0P0F8_ROSAI|nr:hypothetical protein SIAM614_30686 [Stappia aggregata IAM 12614] [Roseibium aggregatum IAM 12614]
MAEQNIRRALLISRGDFSDLVTRPISATIAIATLGLIVWPIGSALFRRRKAAREMLDGDVQE